MSDIDTGQGLWAGIFARLEASLDGLGRALQKRNSLDQWAAPLWHPLPPVSAVGATGPIVFNLGTPPYGTYWKVRAIQATGPTVTAIASVVVDLYIAPAITPAPGQSATGATYVPGVAFWFTSASLSSNPGALPVLISPSSDEMRINSGESLVVVLSGAGVSASVGQFIASGYVTQHQGLLTPGED